MFETLTALVQPWAEWYADHAGVGIGLITVHLLAVFVGGGIAISTDRMILRTAPVNSDMARRAIAELPDTHHIVLRALALAIASGAALFTTDLPTYSVSVVYWIKMGALGALLANGWRLQRSEATLRRVLGTDISMESGEAVAFPMRPWNTLRMTARSSQVLWISIVVLGVILKNG